MSAGAPDGPRACRALERDDGSALACHDRSAPVVADRSSRCRAGPAQFLALLDGVVAPAAEYCDLASNCRRIAGNSKSGRERKRPWIASPQFVVGIGWRGTSGGGRRSPGDDRRGTSGTGDRLPTVEFGGPKGPPSDVAGRAATVRVGVSVPVGRAARVPVGDRGDDWESGRTPPPVQSPPGPHGGIGRVAVGDSRDRARFTRENVVGTGVPRRLAGSISVVRRLGEGGLKWSSMISFS